MKTIRYLFAPVFSLLFIHVSDFARCNDTIVIKKTSDFEISGDGRHSNWALTSWIDIPLRTPKTNYSCKTKLLYS
jgi:hypothetical protein